MRIATIVLASLLAAAAAQAQSVPPASHASDSWNAPAPASTASYRADAASPLTERKSESPFKFKERRDHRPLPGNAAQRHSGNAAVGAMGADSNGRPAVSCPQTPMDPACH
ncbi:hypothetical protein [Frateuria sp. STR12]|uniref:hypothetical protein n=1 Tax=Frateuria hangzhouensis TaxID=2995589 RepID=UPI002260DB4E|nr:hypothetical protein [Frateuria sp. STR12]MCX7513662.1 hypothetical protein [Frateuria sp. STR12]